jgi:hypothetical protein
MEESLEGMRKEHEVDRGAISSAGVYVAFSLQSI